MQQAKYIIVDKEGIEIPIVFSSLLLHNNVALALGYKVVSAGLCEIMNDSYNTFGESFSLGVKSRGKEDADILNRHLNYFNFIS